MSEDDETEIKRDLRQLKNIVVGPLGVPKSGLAFQMEAHRMAVEAKISSQGKDISAIKDDLATIKRLLISAVGLVLATVAVAVLNLVLKST